MPAMPDITKGQVAAFVSVLATVLSVVLKLNLTDTQQAVIVSAIVSVWALGQLVSDAVIRHGRSKIAAAKVEAESRKTLFADTAMPAPVDAAPPSSPENDGDEDILAIEGAEPVEDHSGHPHGADVATDA